MESPLIRHFASAAISRNHGSGRIPTVQAQAVNEGRDCRRGRRAKVPEKLGGYEPIGDDHPVRFDVDFRQKVGQEGDEMGALSASAMATAVALVKPISSAFSTRFPRSMEAGWGA